MKILKYILLTVVSLVVIAAAFFAYGLYINPKSPKGTAEYSSGSTEIDIRYYRPFKNNRLIFWCTRRRSFSSLWSILAFRRKFNHQLDNEHRS